MNPTPTLFLSTKSSSEYNSFSSKEFKKLIYLSIELGSKWSISPDIKEPFKFMKLFTLIRKVK